MAGANQVLIIVGIIGVICLLYVGERVIKARGQARHREHMASRLAAAAARAEEKETKRRLSAAAGAALTSVMPAINRPRDTMEGVARASSLVRSHTLLGERNHGHQRGHGRQHNPGAPHRTGPQHNTGPQHTGPQHNTGPQRRNRTGTGPAR